MDGEVVEGQTTVDESPVTGESTPVEKGPGDPVYSGSLNGGGGMLVRVVPSLYRCVAIKWRSEAAREAEVEEEWPDTRSADCQEPLWGWWLNGSRYFRSR